MLKWLFLVFSLNFTYAVTHVPEGLAADIQIGLDSETLNPIRPHLVFNDPDKAKAWLADMSHRLDKWVKDDYLKTGYLTIIQYEAARANLDPQLVLSIITVESQFNNFAISSAGALGLMQIMPFWQSWAGAPEHNLFNAQTNLRYGCSILRYYLQKENGNIERALARYNGSLGKTGYPDLIMQAYYNYWQPYPVMTVKNKQLITIDYTK